METTTDTKNTITLFDRASSQLQNRFDCLFVFKIVTTISYAFLPEMNKSLHTTLIKISTSRGDPLFHSCYDGIIARKMLPMQSIHLLLAQTDGGQELPDLDNTVGVVEQSRLAMCSAVFKLVWGQALLC